MSNLPSASQSPRLESGVLYWYEFNTFSIQFTLSLKDSQGTAISLQSTDSVDVIFRNMQSNYIDKFTFTNISNNTITLSMDSTHTRMFCRGQYKYDIVLKRTNSVTTLVNDNMVVVE